MWQWQQLLEHGVETADNVTESVIIAHRRASSRCYVGSPSLVALDRNRMVASHDIFGPGSTWNMSEVFLSNDRGASWLHVSAIEGQWWSTLFMHDDALYLMGTSREWGYTVIRRSDDDGRTWTTPDSAETGLLIGGARYHCAPVPIIHHRGRLWRAMEDAGPEWRDFRAFMMSASEQSNLLHADSWTCSNRVRQDKTLLDGHLDEWAEGNAVVDPDGHVVDILRPFTTGLATEKAVIMHISDDGRKTRFDPSSGFIDMPGGGKKFTIRWDPLSSRYWSLTNHVPDPQKTTRGIKARNSLCLVSSADLRRWQVNQVILHHADDEFHAFQYADWLFDGDDIIFVSRTAADEEGGTAHNYHDANYLTYHRLTSFRRTGED